MLCVIFCVIVVKENEQLRVGVLNGQRPDLHVITGPETLRSATVTLIEHCWHQSPDERPEFAGMEGTKYCFTRIVRF